MEKIYLSVLCGLLILAMAGCGTIRGLGEDLNAVGKWLIKGSDTVKEGQEAVKEEPVAVKEEPLKRAPESNISW